MRKLRNGLFLLSAILIVGGYLASTSFALRGQAAEWAQRIDQPSVKWLALAIVLAALGFGFLPNDESEEVAD